MTRASGSCGKTCRPSSGDRADYEWQWSPDEGTTWHDAPRTTQAKTVLAGLPVGEMCAFRYRVRTKDATSDSSEPLAWRVT